MNSMIESAIKLDREYFAQVNHRQYMDYYIPEATVILSLFFVN